jgi:integrase
MKRIGRKTRSGVFAYQDSVGQRWGVDYRDPVTRKRKRKAGFLNKELALLFKNKKERQLLRLEPLEADQPDTLLDGYAVKWLSVVAATISPSTLRSYQGALRIHVLPALGQTSLRSLVKGNVRDFLAAKLKTGLSRSSVRILHATLRTLLNAARDDGMIASNPAEGLGRQLKLSTSPRDREDEIKAMTREQLDHFLAVAKELEPGYHPLLFTMARTGLRLGEAFGLQWEDLDLENREIHVRRSVSGGRVGSTKTGRVRTVDMSSQLRDLLRGMQAVRNRQLLKDGEARTPKWVFTNQAGGSLDQSKVSRIFKRIVREAGLPPHLHPHCLRHTFASLLLQQGESPAYVQRQLGHSSIQLTVDTYGRWLPMGKKAAVDALDSRPAVKEVAAGA